MKASEIFSEIEKHAPLTLALDFDSAGLSVGNPNAQVSRVLLCENVTMSVIKEAVNNNCELIISHHPAIFGEVMDAFTMEIVKAAKENNLILYSAHTNLDAAVGGINDELCEMLHITSIEGNNTCHRIGTLNNPKSLAAELEEVKGILAETNVRSCGDLTREIKTVCVSCGAGARDDELVEELRNKNVDVLIGGENKLSLAIKMLHYNICLIEVGHYTSEIVCMNIFEKWLKNLGITLIKSKADTNPYNG